MRQRFVLLLLACLLFALSKVSHGGDGSCDHCGCDDSCNKVCRLVCEEKKVEITCWGCKCEDFCIGSHGKRGCTHCETICDSCDESGDANAPYSKPKNFVWSEWFPGCGAKMYSKKKLMKKTVTKKIPTYKWVVEDLCKECESSAPVAIIDADAEIAPPPVVVGATLIDGIRISVDVQNDIR